MDEIDTVYRMDDGDGDKAPRRQVTGHDEATMFKGSCHGNECCDVSAKQF